MGAWRVNVPAEAGRTGLASAGRGPYVAAMARGSDSQRDLWAALAFAAVFALLFGHGAVLAREGLAAAAIEPPSRGFSLLLRGLGGLGINAQAVSGAIAAVAASISLVLVVALATGTEAIGEGGVLARRLPSLIPALLLAASPLFARGVLVDGDAMLFTALLLAGGHRAFVETHTPGRLPLSAVTIGLASAFDCAGLLVLLLVALQKVIFARKFRLPRAVYAFAFVWLGVGALVAAVAYWLTGFAPRVAPGTVSVGLWRSITAFMASVDGLALVPFVAVLCFAWKPKEVYFRLTLVAAVLIALVIMAGRLPEETLDRALAPAMPWAFLIAGEALRSVRAVLETAGFRARERRILGVIVVGSLTLAQLWPTVTRLSR